MFIRNAIAKHRRCYPKITPGFIPTEKKSTHQARL